MPHLTAAVALGGEAVAAEAGDEDGGPLHAFGFVHGEDLDGIGLGESVVFPTFGVVAGGLIVEEAGEAGVEALGVALEVDLFVVGDDLAEFAEVVEDDFAGAAVVGLHVFFAELDGLEEVEVEALQEDAGVGAVGGEALLAAADEVEAGADLGGCAVQGVGGKQAGEGLLVDGVFTRRGEVGHVVEEGAHGVGFGGGEEFVDAADDEGDAGAVQGLDDGAGVFAHGAEEDGDVAVGEAAGVAAGAVLVGGADEVFDFGDDPVGFAVGIGKLEGEEVAEVEGLGVGGFHALGEALGVALDDLAGGFDDADAAAEVFVELDLLDVWVTLGEGDDVFDFAAAPLVDGLVVVADDAEGGAEVVQVADEALLQGVDVLVFVDDEVLELAAELVLELGVGLQGLDGFADDHGVVEIALVVQELAVLGDGVLHGGGDLLHVDAAFGEDGDELLVEGGVEPAGEGAAGEERGAGEAALGAVAVDEEALLDVVEDGVFEVFVEGWGLEELEAVAVDGADEDVAEALAGAEALEGEAVDAVFEFAGGFFGEGEGDDAGGGDAGGEELDDAGGDDLGFAGAGAGDDLEVLVDGVDGLLLSSGVGEWHVTRPFGCCFARVGPREGG